MDHMPLPKNGREGLLEEAKGTSLKWKNIFNASPPVKRKPIFSNWFPLCFASYGENGLDHRDPDSSERQVVYAKNGRRPSHFHCPPPILHLVHSFFAKKMIWHHLPKLWAMAEKILEMLKLPFPEEELLLNQAFFFQGRGLVLHFLGHLVRAIRNLIEIARFHFKKKSLRSLLRAMYVPTGRGK